MNGYSVLDEVNADNFNEVALQSFKYVYENNEVYHKFCSLLNKRPGEVKNLKDIPFLPVEFFKTHEIITPKKEPEAIFESSGTSESTLKSKHYVSDLELYQKGLIKTFELFFGPPTEYCILALLPSYLERSNSSLVYMVQELMNDSNHELNDFYLYDLDRLISVLSTLKEGKQPTILFGVSFALLDLAEKGLENFPELTIIETGGMKGRRKELIREELHQILSSGLNTNRIFSEYGMTELLSQSYAGVNCVFKCPPWMKVLIRDVHDPLSTLQDGKTGGINVIDLLNINSCPFIATQDLGRYKEDGFEVLGRFDNSDIRGCNLMWS